MERYCHIWHTGKGNQDCSLRCFNLGPGISVESVFPNDGWIGNVLSSNIAPFDIIAFPTHELCIWLGVGLGVMKEVMAG